MRRKAVDKVERVENALSGAPQARPPVSLWYHFGIQHGRGAQLAAASLDFFRHYDFDFLKVMNDYFYPMPEGLDGVASAEHLGRIAPFDVERSPWSEQLRALEILSRELKGEAYFLDTVFDPWHTLKRSLAGENLASLMQDEPDAVLAALSVITDNLIAYCARSLQIGAAGVFLSVPAGRETIGRREFLRFVKPFTARLLAAVADRARMNTVHLHGEDLHFEDCLDLPARVLNWWDRGPKGPSLAAAKAQWGACVMGGIDHTAVTRKTGAFLRAHVREGLEQGGGDRFLLAGGCSIDSSVNPRAIRAIVEAARAG